jgi:hypothetical protein
MVNPSLQLHRMARRPSSATARLFIRFLRRQKLLETRPRNYEFRNHRNPSLWQFLRQPGPPALHRPPCVHGRRVDLGLCAAGAAILRAVRHDFLSVFFCDVLSRYDLQQFPFDVQASLDATPLRVIPCMRALFCCLRALFCCLTMRLTNILHAVC